MASSCLIVIVGVEVGEVLVGVGLPSELWVEVLLPFLQNQIVFVECLRKGNKNGTSQSALVFRVPIKSLFSSEMGRDIRGCTEKTKIGNKTTTTFSFV